MADVSFDTIDFWWQQTPDYSWDSLRQSLYQVLQNQTISDSLYNDLLSAVNKLESLKISFPKSSAELMSRLDHYL